MCPVLHAEPGKYGTMSVKSSHKAEMQQFKDIYIISVRATVLEGIFQEMFSKVIEEKSYFSVIFDYLFILQNWFFSLIYILPLCCKKYFPTPAQAPVISLGE